MYIVCADHSGPIVDFLGFVELKEALDFAENLQTIYECKEDSNLFLNGEEDRLECVITGDPDVHFSIEPKGFLDDGSELYEIKGDWDNEESDFWEKVPPTILLSKDRLDLYLRHSILNEPYDECKQRAAELLLDRSSKYTCGNYLIYINTGKEQIKCLFFKILVVCC